MAGELKCRECHKPCAGAAHFTFANNGIKGRTLCVACLDQHMAKYNSRTVEDFIPAYVRVNRDQSQVFELRQRVTELEHLLEQLTRP